MSVVHACQGESLELRQDSVDDTGVDCVARISAVVPREVNELRHRLVREQLLRGVQVEILLGQRREHESRKSSKTEVVFVVSDRILLAFKV